MNRSVINQLNQINYMALHNVKAPDRLINRITKLCGQHTNLGKIYSEFGLMSYRGAIDLLGNNVLAAQRQHDLADVEYYRERKGTLSPINKYFIETVHGCHVAPTVRPVTNLDVITLIRLVKRQLIK